jgi:chloramphenicol O-acetyltransferase type B
MRDFFKRKLQPVSIPINQPFSLSNPHAQWSIGRGTYGDPHIHDWGEGARLKVGAFCSIANGVKIFLGGEHRIDWITTYPFNVLWPQAQEFAGHPATKGDVSIGNDVWIATDAVILSGVSIGDGAVIGARAVVTKNVAPYSVVAGNPARAMRTRFEQSAIERLLKVCWWDWPDHRIQLGMPFLLNSDIEGFLEFAETSE